MIAEIEAGNVSTVLAKDLSRVGREYLQTGFYTEVYFREKNVRFIAIDNNIDSVNRDSNEFAPFLNIMNEHYARDNSRKLKNAFRAKGKLGKRTTNKAVYGFIKDPNDKTKWVVDTEADKSSGKREQCVEIFLKHIGRFTAPGSSDNAESSSGDQRTAWRENKRNQRAKAKQAQDLPAQDKKTA